MEIAIETLRNGDFDLNAPNHVSVPFEKIPKETFISEKKIFSRKYSGLLSSRLLSKNLKDQDIQNYNFACCFYGCETWSLTLREERRLSVFENRVLRGISGGKRDEMTWEWRKLHNEELNDLYSFPNIVRVVK
jgi:hypothetical protein